LRRIQQRLREKIIRNNDNQYLWISICRKNILPGRRQRDVRIQPKQGLDTSWYPGRGRRGLPKQCEEGQNRELSGMM